MWLLRASPSFAWLSHIFKEHRSLWNDSYLVVGWCFSCKVAVSVWFCPKNCDFSLLYFVSCLVDSFKISERAILKPFRLFISEVFKGEFFFWCCCISFRLLIFVLCLLCKCCQHLDLYVSLMVIVICGWWSAICSFLMLQLTCAYQFEVIEVCGCK